MSRLNATVFSRSASENVAAGPDATSTMSVALPTVTISSIVSPAMRFIEKLYVSPTSIDGTTALSVPLTVTRYGPPGSRRVARNRPSSLLVSERVTPLRVSSTMMDAPATGAPFGSRILPRIADVVSCAFDATGMATSTMAASAATDNCLNIAKLDPISRDLCFIIDPRFSKMRNLHARLRQSDFAWLFLP